MMITISGGSARKASAIDDDQRVDRADLEGRGPSPRTRPSASPVDDHREAEPHGDPKPLAMSGQYSRAISALKKVKARRSRSI